MQFRPCFLCVVLALSAVTGCQPRRAEISGTATFDGEPIENGVISLLPADGVGESSGGPIIAGKFAVTDIPPGKKIVEIAAVKKVNFARSSEEMQKMSAQAVANGDDSGLIDPADIIPPDAEGNRQPIELKAERRTIDFHLRKAKSP